MRRKTVSMEQYIFRSPTVAQLVKKFPAFYGTRRLTSLLLDPILSQLNPMKALKLITQCPAVMLLIPLLKLMT